MTFNDNAQLDTSRVQKRGRGTKGVAVGGGSVIGVVVLYLLSQFLGVDLTGLAGGGQPVQQQEQAAGSGLEHCQSGADANKHMDCRMTGAENSLDAYWSSQGSALGIRYRSPGFVLYEGETQSACGTASNAVGPFYCPADQSMYLDTSFFDLMEQQLGAEDGPLAEMYVVAHEWGHHMQHQLGVLQQISQQDSGPGSDAVRVELQADCFSGAWMKYAVDTKDRDGVALLKPFTDEQIQNALGAAHAVGDDHIQSQGSGNVNPESFTHGTSEQRKKWLMTGYQHGWGQCDTFAIPASQL